jgi:hypothetical protein
VLPTGIIASVLFVGAIEWIAGRRPRRAGLRQGGEAAILGAALLLLPSCVFFALSRWTELRLFENRYLLPSAPGLILLWGCLMRNIDPPSVRRIALIGILAQAILRFGGFSPIPNYRREDWRSAVRTLPDSGALLVYTGLVETRRLDWLKQPDRWDYFTAPVSFYRPTISPEDTFLLPFDFNKVDQSYVERLIAGPLVNRERITLILRTSFFGPAWADWLSARLSPAGFRKRIQSSYGNIEVHVFQAEVHEAAIPDHAKAVETISLFRAR